jgi:hypothetical protein
MAKTNKVEVTKKDVPSKAKFWDTTVGKTLRAAIYLAISAAVAGVIADIENNPQLFGQLTPLINIALVAVKNFLSPSVKNI